MAIDKRQQLRKHKFIATGLFVVMVITYFLMVYGIKYSDAAWMHYVKAFSEAGMVGALADWFAVTALFRYPLGIKIPHTNLIENSKNAIGDNLGTFVTENFLTPGTIRPYINKLNVADFISDWLNQPKNKLLITTEINRLLSGILYKMDDEMISNLFAKKGKEAIDNLPFEVFASKGLEYIIENNEHNKLINLIIPEAKSYIENNRGAIYDKVVEKQPLLGLIGGKSVTNQLISGITSFLKDVEENEAHEIRDEITRKLFEVSEELRTSDEWKQKFTSLKNEFISMEKIQNYANDAWLNLKKEIILNLENKTSVLNTYIEKNIDELANNLSTDQQWKDKINSFVKQFVYKLALRNSKEVGTIISTTVENWDGKELSEKLELEVGKDLQYIRINGTIVGGLVGLIIYIVTEFIFS